MTKTDFIGVLVCLAIVLLLIGLGLWTYATRGNFPHNHRSRRHYR